MSVTVCPDQPGPSAFVLPFWSPEGPPQTPDHDRKGNMNEQVS